MSSKSSRFVDPGVEVQARDREGFPELLALALAAYRRRGMDTQYGVANLVLVHPDEVPAAELVPAGLVVQAERIIGCGCLWVGRSRRDAQTET